MRKFFGVLCIVLGVLTSIPVLAAWSVRATLLESAPWKAALRESRVYERSLEELPAVLLSDPENFGSAIQATPLSTADFTEVVQAVVSEAQLQDVVERGIDVALAIVRSEVAWEQASLVVGLQDTKVRAPAAVQALLVKKLTALPTCTEAQAKIYAQRKDLNGVLPPCIPKGVDIRALVSASIPVQEIANAIPSTVDILAEARKNANQQAPCSTGEVRAASLASDEPCKQSNPAASIAEAQTAVQTGLRYHLLLTLVSLLLCIGAGLLFLPRMRSAFRWFGVCIATAGIVNLIIAVQGRMQMGRDFTQPTEPLGQALVSIFLPVAKNLGNHVTTQYMTYAALCIVAGAIAFAISYAWKPKAAS